MKAILIILSSCVLNVLHSQVTEEWVARYSGSLAGGYDIAHDIALDKFGNVYVTGSSQASAGGQDYLTIKYNSHGAIEWTARYNNSAVNSHDQAYNLAVDDSGNVYVTGGSFGNGTERDFLTIKYNSDGDTLWTRRYNGPGFDLDESVEIELDSDANVYITGYSETAGNLDYYTIKYNTDGIEQWASRYNGPAGPLGSEDRPHFLALDKSGNVYITGESSAGLTGTGLDRYATVKYNQSGDTVWTALYSGSGVEGLNQAYALSVDDSGNVFVTGRSDPENQFGYNFDMLTIKYNPDGSTAWIARYNGPGNSTDIGNSIAPDNNGNVIVAGGSLFGGFFLDLCLVKYNPSGDTIWVRRYNGPEDHVDVGNAIAADESGNIYVAGLSTGTGTLRDYVTLKYNSEGIQQWVMRYNGPTNGDDEINAMIIDESGNVYVTGRSAGNGVDYATIKYSSGVTSIKNEKSSLNQFTLEQNFPNPFNPGTTISWQSPVDSWQTLTVYDLLGREVATLVDEFKPAGKHEISFDGSKLSSGVYLYKLTAGGFTSVKKLILLK